MQHPPVLRQKERAERRLLQPRSIRRALYQTLVFAQVLSLLLSAFVTMAPPASAAPVDAPYAAPVAAPAVPLSMTSVAAPDINCLFDADCTIVVDDATDNFSLPGGTGDGFLQSRLWPVGEAGAAGQGLYAYLYRIDATEIQAVTAEACVSTMSIEFGPIVAIDFDGDGSKEEVFVITKGGLGSVAPASVEQTDNDLTVTFSPPICPGETSYFVGLASQYPKQDVTAKLQGSLGFEAGLRARAPLYRERDGGRIAYIFKESTVDAADFKTLLENNGFTVDLIPLANLLATNLNPYDLAIIATDTGYLGSWGLAPGQSAHVAAARIPVIGINEGGYAYFGEQTMQIGWPHGWHGSGQNIRGLPALSIYQTPYDLTPLLAAPLQIYSADDDMVSIHMPSPISGVTPLAWEPADNQHAPLIAEEQGDVCSQLWGFADAPSAMTPNGKRLFVNAVHFGLDNCPGATDVPEPGCYELFSPREIPSPSLIQFDDLADASVIGSYYQASHGVVFEDGKLASVKTQANATAVSSPNVARNQEADPDGGAAVPLSFKFESGKTHVGFYMGNGDADSVPGSMVGYDAAGNVICQVTNAPVPKEHREFIGMFDPQGRIARVTLNYGSTPLAESIDDLYFAPFDGDVVGHELPTPETPLSGGENVPAVEIQTSNVERFAATVRFPEAHLWAVKGPDEVEYVQVGMPGIDPGSGQTGQPDVPILRKLLAVPRGAKVELAGARPKSADQLAAIVYPSQPQAADAPLNQDEKDEPIPVEDFEDLPFAVDEKAYAGSDSFPARIVDIQTIGRVRDLDLVQVSIAAGQFNPAKGVLDLFESVEFEIVFEGGERGFLPENQADNPFDQAYEPIYALTMNKAAIYEAYFPIKDIVWGCVGSEYLIITDPAFRPAADDLRAWKIGRGMSTSILETGNGAGNAGTTADQIKSAIKYRYDNCHVRPSYVLLLGDAEQIPPFYRSTHYGDLAGTDLPYTTMDFDEFVPTPDIAIGRMPVDTLAQALTIVDKVINYESVPTNSKAFYEEMSFAAYFQCCRPDVAQDGTAARSFLETAEFVRSFMTGQGYGVERIYTTSTAYHSNPAKSGYNDSGTRSTTPNRYYNSAMLPVDLRASSGYPWNGGTTDVIDAINDGRFLVFHRDHGGISGWGSPGFGSSNLASLTNGAKTPVVYSINCASGLFDNETRNPANDAYTYNTSVGGSYWAERILRMEGGAVGVIGDTRNSPTWANSAFARGLFDATWPALLPADGSNTSIRRLGDILNYSKVYLIGQAFVPQSSGSVSLDAALTDVTLYHVYGDPTMAMWTKYPWQVALPGFADDFKVIEQDLWKLRYPINGATITLLQDGMPVGRGPVVNGEAELALIEEFDPEAPFELSASLPGAISRALALPDAIGNATPESGGGLSSPSGDLKLTFGPGVAPVPVKLFYEELPAPSFPIVGTDWLAPVGPAAADAGPWMTDVIPSSSFVLEAIDEAGSPVTQFNGDYTVEQSYSAAGLADEGVDEMDQHCLTYDESIQQWLRIGTDVDAERKVVTCSADHFTEFAIVGLKVTSGSLMSEKIYLPAVMR